MNISEQTLSNWTFHVCHISTILGNPAATSFKDFSTAWTAKVLNLQTGKASVEYAFWLDLNKDGSIKATISDLFVNDAKMYQLHGYCKYHDIETEIL